MFKNLKIIEIETLLEDIDDLLARLEDHTHDEDGKDITKIRHRIEKILLKMLD